MNDGEEHPLPESWVAARIPTPLLLERPLRGWLLWGGWWMVGWGWGSLTMTPSCLRASGVWNSSTSSLSISLYMQVALGRIQSPAFWSLEIPRNHYCWNPSRQTKNCMFFQFPYATGWLSKEDRSLQEVCVQGLKIRAYVWFQLAYHTARPADGKQIRVSQEEISRSAVFKHSNGKNKEIITPHAK